MFDRNGNRKYLNLPERELLLRIVSEETDLSKKTFCLTLLLTGCRISEPLNLTRDRIDLTDKALVIKTLKQRQHSRFRSVPIPDSLVEQLERLLAEQESGVLVWKFFTNNRLPAYQKENGASEVFRRQGLPKRTEARLRGCLHIATHSVDNCSKMVRSRSAGNDGGLGRRNR